MEEIDESLANTLHGKTRLRPNQGIDSFLLFLRFLFYV